MNNAKKIISILFFLIITKVFVFSQNSKFGESNIPFSTDSINLTIWNGETYIPFFVKGMNLGISVPGKFPGQLEATKEQYGRWFEQIKEAGYNSIRLYTLHFPHFYEVLDSFNNANPKNPLFFFQGVWLEEEMENYNQDLYFFDDFFTNEIEENIDCVHGNRTIEERPGKAWGDFNVDASNWLIGYIIGREVHPGEVLYTNEVNISENSFSGDFLSISNCSPAEAFITKKMNHVIDYENENYAAQHPVSFSSWPTLDPIEHPLEQNQWEDTISINLSLIDASNAQAGIFISYHAYPYYPDFISKDINYQDFQDAWGKNTYLGYLNDLKSHYPNFPLIIAEFGVPSSWGIAHYSASGMNHGGQTHSEQAEDVIRMLGNIQTSNCGGGIQFAWIDEWFKRTWITDPIDFMQNRRVLWHNITAAEQNFGLIEFSKSLTFQTLEAYSEMSPITKVEAAVDYAFLHLKLSLYQQFDVLDEIWLGIDTYNSELGESILPNGQEISNRAEFALKITNYSAELYVTQAYDLFGIWHQTSEDYQLYHSIATDGEPWRLVRWKNNDGVENVQYIGNLVVNKNFLPQTSKDAVTIYPNYIEIKIPWSLLQFVDPSEMIVFDDNRETNEVETTTSDGIAFSIFYKYFAEEITNRYSWEFWNHALEAEENLKKTYYIIKNNLYLFNNHAIAVADSFNTQNAFPFEIDEYSAVLKNDFDLDGDYFEVLQLENCENGVVDLDLNGSFTYTPNYGFSGIDNFTYCIYDGQSLSNEAKVYISVDEPVMDIFENNETQANLKIYPNPASENLYIECYENIEEIEIFDFSGTKVLARKEDSQKLTVNITNLDAGIYFVKTKSKTKYLLKKVVVLK